MQNVDRKSLIESINATPTKAVLFITGGGLDVFGEMTHNGGGSATLLSGLIPYDPKETIQLLGNVKPEKLVCEETTRTMAMVAFQRALALSEGAYPVIGVASSSILQKTPEERIGREHFIYAALQTDTKSISLTIKLNIDIKPADTTVIRRAEEDANVAVILNLIAEGCGLDFRESLRGLEPLRHESTLEGISISKITNGWREPILVECQSIDGEPKLTTKSETWHDISFRFRFESDKVALFPGSFNPLHAAHEELATLAAAQLGMRVEYEISIGNVEKPMLDLISLEERLKHFCGKEPKRVWISNAPTFLEKSKQFESATFIVGFDTAKRICDPKYAGNVEEVMYKFLENGVHFLVFGREQNGVYRSGFNEFPPSFKQIATANTEPRKYPALSSTEIRRHTQ